MSYNLPILECKRCGHRWSPRTEEKPIVCPDCKSPYWDKERIREKKGEKKDGNKDSAIGKVVI